MSKILIIEDDLITAKVYSTRLSGEGYTVKVASNAAEGMDCLDEYRPDGLLVDFMMPGMNGLDLVRGLRTEEKFKDIPIIVFSNALVPVVVEEALRAGANHVFDKSELNPGLLIQVLHTVELFPKKNAQAA